MGIYTKTHDDPNVHGDRELEGGPRKGWTAERKRDDSVIELKGYGDRWMGMGRR